jgi:hypothetical protein
MLTRTRVIFPFCDLLKEGVSRSVAGHAQSFRFGKIADVGETCRVENLTASKRYVVVSSYTYSGDRTCNFADCVVFI